MCSHRLFPVVASSLEQVVVILLQDFITVIDLFQVVPTRLIQAVVIQAVCYEVVVIKLVNILLRADDIRLVGTTCCESVGLINLVAR
jgi:hypothetical protein